MLISQGTWRNHYFLVAQLISDITKFECKFSGKFEEKRKRSHDLLSGPKTMKRKWEREDSNEITKSSSSKSSVCEIGHKTTKSTKQLPATGLANILSPVKKMKQPCRFTIFWVFSLCIPMLHFARLLSLVDNYLKVQCFRDRITTTRLC